MIYVGEKKYTHWLNCKYENLSHKMGISMKMNEEVGSLSHLTKD